MKDKTRKTTLIVLISVAMLGSILLLTLVSFVTSNSMFKETVKQSVQQTVESNADQQSFYSSYTQGKSADELVEQSLKGYGVIQKLIGLKLVLQIVMLVSTIKGPNKYKMALKYLSILNLIMSFDLISIVILIMSCIESNDVPCEKPKAPDMEKVDTFKLPVYIISFLAIWLLIYNGLLTKFVPQIKEWGRAHDMLFEVLFFAVLALLVFILLRKELVRDFKVFKNNFGTYHNFAARGFFWIMVLNLTSGIILNRIVGGTSENQAALNEMPLWFMIIFGTLIGPMVEEGIYRGMLGKFVKNKVAFVIISTLLFAAMHVVTITALPESPMQYLFLIQYGLMGLVLSINYTRTKNLFSSYMVHMIMNGVGTTLTALILL